VNRSRTELGRELLDVLSSFATLPGDLDVLLAQDPIAALDRIDRLVQHLDGARAVHFFAAPRSSASANLQTPTTLPHYA